jgi:hypothetical protein
MKDRLFFGRTEEEIEQHTPAIAATEILLTLKYFVNVVREKGKGYFEGKFYKPVLDGCIKIRDPEKLSAQKPILKDQSLECFATECTNYYISAATIFAIDALEEYQNGRSNSAWILTLEAERHLGAAIGSDPACFLTKTVKSDLARNNAFKMHQDDNDLRDDALKFYRDNIGSFSSMNEAAKKIVKEIVPLKFTTVRRYLTEFHKENPVIPKPGRHN